MFSVSPSTPDSRPAARPVARLFLLALVLLAAGLSPAPIRRAAAAVAQSPVDAAGFLTGPAAGDPLAIALAYIREHRAELGLSEDDLGDFVVKDRYTSPNNGVTHIYLRQRLDGIEVYGADINVNVARSFCDPTRHGYGYDRGFAITAGRHHLDGAAALAYARARKAAGESDERVNTVAAWRDAPFFTDAERAALALAEEATRLAGPDPVSDDVWAEAAKHYNEQELAGLLLAIGFNNLWHRLMPTTRQPAQSLAG